MEKNYFERYGQKCEFDPRRDSHPVRSGLQVDVDDALQSGIVKDGTLSEDYNGISDADGIVGRVESIFDAIEASRAIRKYGKKADPPVTPTAPSGAVEPAKNE